MRIIALYAALLALLYIALTINVIRLRYKHKISLGHRDIPELERAIRAHGNFAEYVPLTLIMVGLSAHLGAPPWVLHLLGGALLLARLSHAYYLCVKYKTIFRQIGVVLTLLILLISSLSSLFL